jgi:excisionase family DNA binding protein
MLSPSSESPDDRLLRPREVAALFGVRPSTIARWARSGRLRPLLTPGGHRRYRLPEIRELLDLNETPPEQNQLEQDAVRLYEQGWGIRQVAEQFGTTYGTMRRLLLKHTALRSRGTSSAERRIRED